MRARRVVVVGATGNVGTSLLRVLRDEPGVDSVLGIARRLPPVEIAKTEWARADVTTDDLVPLFRGADVVVHLAWAIQPSRNPNELRTINVLGSDRVFRAVAEARVPALIYASSVGAYSPGPKDKPVDERWPTEGTPTSFYARHKTEVERRLDIFEREQPTTRVVRLRPGLVFKREAAAEIRRLFLGPLLPSPLLRPERIPFVPDVAGLRFQAVHSHDVGEAYRLAVTGDVSGPFNIAGEPTLDPQRLAKPAEARKDPRREGDPVQPEGRTSSAGHELASTPPTDPAGVARHGAGRPDHGYHACKDGARLGTTGPSRSGALRAARRPEQTRRRRHSSARPRDEWTAPGDRAAHACGRVAWGPKPLDDSLSTLASPLRMTDRRIGGVAGASQIANNPGDAGSRGRRYRRVRVGVSRRGAGSPGGAAA
jgi:UDP-glucose 4-epimerase